MKTNTNIRTPENQKQRCQENKIIKLTGQIQAVSKWIKTAIYNCIA